MRFIISGVGAIGGTVAACLAGNGREVAGIARGRQLDAIREGGLTLKTPDGGSHVRFDCAADIASLGLRPDDVILLCVKSQDTQDVLERLAAAGATRQPVLCLQNGVANERVALRYFENVYGVSVMMPCDFAAPGLVHAFGTPHPGIFDIGRYPSGRDGTTEEIAGIFNEAGIVSFVHEQVMASKYGKLLVNLHNVLEAGFGREDAYRSWAEKAREEAAAAYRAAGIEWQDVGFNDPRREQYMKMGTIPGVRRMGSSSTQSLMRGAGSIETDYLNGEIALLGRLHGVPVPVNAALCRIGRKLLAGSLDLGKVKDADIKAELAAA
ncbi:MAG: ketopantoate reductase family protein [Salaquimonas sp.]|jgi:2-dehydropantoate 2-reductase|nr:ketopantoate reductase family protein [Salaquimonas sp.]